MVRIQLIARLERMYGFLTNEDVDDRDRIRQTESLLDGLIASLRDATTRGQAIEDPQPERRSA